MALKEFPANGNSHAALFDITRGDFSFTAGELAKAGHLEIATPFANIRGRSRVGGIGTLSLISLFFAAMEKVQAAGPAIGYLDDGVIIANYKDDEPHGSFELVTKEATPRRIFVDDPGVTWALRLNSSSELSVSQVSNSPAQMIQLQAIQQNVLRTYAVGLQAMQGPTVSGPNGSPTPIFDLPGSNLQRINFGPSDNSPAIENLNSSPQSSPNSSSLKTTSATTSTSGSSQNTASSIEESIFIPPPPPPPPANVLTPPVITTTAPALDNASSINIAGTAPANSTVALANNGNAIGTTTADASGHWSINGIALSNGANYSFTATATDVSNNSSPPSNQLAFQVDQTPPAVPVITTTAPAQNNASSINVAGTAEANSTVTLSNNGSPVGTTTADGSGHWSVNGIPLSNGADNNFTATATDAANNASGPSNALTFHDDQTAPSATFPTVALTSDTGAASSDFITSNGGVHFAGTAADTGGAGLASVQVFNGATLLGTATVVAGNWSLDTTLAAGTYNNLMVTVTDLAGNTNTTTNTQTIIVDTAPPAAGTLSFSNLTDSGTANTPPVTTDNTFNLTLTGQESGAAVAYQASLNGGAFAATTASQSGLADGDYQFRALVTDAAGNTSTSNVIEVVVDNSVPAAGTLSFSNLTDSGTANTPPVTTDNTFNLTLTGQESGAAVAYQASLNGGAFAATTASQSGLADGDYQFRALVTDAAGNTSTSNVIEVVVDNSVPAAGTLSFSNLTDSGTANTPPVTTDNTFNLTLTGQESGAAVAYQASLNGGAFAATTASQSGLADGDYQFRALVTDAAGNTSTSNVIEVVVDNSAPAEALAITAIATDTGTAGDFITSDTTLIVSGSNGALAAGEKIQISSDGTNWFDVTPIDSTHWSYDDTATPHTSSFTYQARILDTAGNIGTTASQAITIANLPAEAVAITAITTDTGTAGDFITSDTTLIVSGSNGALAAGEKIQISSDGTNWFDVTPIDSTHWSYDDTANPHLSNVTYQVRVIDAANNVGTTASQLVTIDTAPPAAGTLSFSNLTDSGTANTPPVTTDNTFNLTLTGQESGAAVAYQASLNGGAFAATTASQSGLADGDYQFRALVTDAAGNTSTSNVIEVVVDNSVPAAGTLSFSNLTDSGTANTPPVTTDNTFNLTLTGQESGAAVAYQASLNGGAFAATTASQSGLADGDYQFRALVTDAAGNTSTSNVIEVVVDNSVPAEALSDHGDYH